MTGAIVITLIGSPVAGVALDVPPVPVSVGAADTAGASVVAAPVVEAWVPAGALVVAPPEFFASLPHAAMSIAIAANVRAIIRRRRRGEETNSMERMAIPPVCPSPRSCRRRQYHNARTLLLSCYPIKFDVGASQRNGAPLW